MSNAPIFLLLFCFTLFGCRGDLSLDPAPRNITKADREQIGQHVKAYLLEDSGLVFFPAIGQRLTAIGYLQTLYRQATIAYRRDVGQSEIFSWDREREWEVFVFESEEDIAFCIPGGDLFISDGFLRQIRYDSELYHIMMIEAVLMEDEVLLQKAVEAFGTRSLLDIADQGNSVDLSVAELTDFILGIRYSFAEVGESLDVAVSRICSTSLFDPTTLFALLSSTVVAPWHGYRAIVTSTDDVIPLSSDGSCGDVVDTGQYSQAVLQNL